jgi:redox-sensing transcriptional repressor
VQVRRDLNAIGFSGTRGVGYQAYDLVEAVRDILGLRQTYNIALVGAGNLGSAIAASTILPKRGFVIHDVFDNDAAKIGRTVGNVVVKHIDELKRSVDEAEEIIGIIATPASAAQEVAELMVDAGIRVILNYTDVLLHVPSDVDVHRIDPTAQLMHTLYYLTQAEGQEAS